MPAPTSIKVVVCSRNLGQVRGTEELGKRNTWVVGRDAKERGLVENKTEEDMEEKEGDRR